MSAVFQLAPLYLVAIGLSLTTTLMLKLQRPLVAVESGEEWEGFAGWKLQAFKRKKKKKPKMYPQGHCDHREDSPEKLIQVQILKLQALSPSRVSGGAQKPEF